MRAIRKARKLTYKRLLEIKEKQHQNAMRFSKIIGNNFKRGWEHENYM